MPVSQLFRDAVKLSPVVNYRLALAAGVYPTTLSKIINGAQPVKPGDKRVLAVGRLLNLSPEECFE